MFSGVCGDKVPPEKAPLPAGYVEALSLHEKRLWVDATKAFDAYAKTARDNKTNHDARLLSAICLVRIRETAKAKLALERIKGDRNTIKSSPDTVAAAYREWLKDKRIANDHISVATPRLT